MKLLTCLIQYMLISFVFCMINPSYTSAAEIINSNYFINRIDGIVWDPNRKPVPDVYVELQNELYSTLARVRTTSTGRFSFTVARQGNYIIKVLSSGTNYLDSVEPVELFTGANPNASDSIYIDIYLKYDKRKINNGLPPITEAIFVQEVSDEARKLYKTGLKNLSENNDKGLDELEQALKISPDYYDALNTLGNEYVKRKEYQKSLPYLIKAIDVNQRSYSCFYGLAYSAYQLNHIPEAIKAAKSAVILQSNSVYAQLLYGTVLRVDGNYELAEKVLLKAKELSKNSPIGNINWQLALLYNRIGRNSEAIAELETYLKVEPDAANKKEIKELIEKLRTQTKK